MRIILADHHPQPLWALRVALEEQPEFDLVGEAMNAQVLLELAEKFPADLILLDCELPDITFEYLIAQLHSLEPRPIVLGMSSEFENSRRVLNSGADAFVSKGDEPGWMLAKLHKYAKQVKMRRLLTDIAP